MTRCFRNAVTVFVIVFSALNKVIIRVKNSLFGKIYVIIINIFI